MTKILDYCETYDVDVQEIGDILEEDNSFKTFFYNDCLTHNSMRDDDYNQRITKMEELDVW